jgi:2-oxo-4-hydroxy-4-carboxy--5-ureidoimidazoline (OHCU) decarboxylase
MATSKTQPDESAASRAADYREHERLQALHKAFSWITRAEELDRNAALAPRAFRDRKLPGRLRAHARRLVGASGLKEIVQMRADHGDEETRRRLLGAHPEHWEKKFGAPYQEQWRLSSANPNRALALAMRGEPTEDFTSPRGRSIVDGVRHFEKERWKRFVDFYAANDKAEEDKRESYSKGWEIFVGAWEHIVTAVRNGEIKWSAIPDGAALPVEMPGDSLGLVQLTDFDKISQSEVIINGRRFVDVRFQAVKDAPGVVPPPKGITAKEVREAIEAAGPEPKAYTIATGLMAKHPDDPRTHEAIRTKVRREMEGNRPTAPGHFRTDQVKTRR